MSRKRKVHTSAFKAQVALAAVKGDRTINELAGQFEVHPTLIHSWKKQLLAGCESIFDGAVHGSVFCISGQRTITGPPRRLRGPRHLGPLF